MPLRLRPTAPIAADAVLVGDPGRALLLAQELLTQPKMSNHARGLWGYSGETPDGRSMTIQSTGMGGPSAGLIIADLAELGVRRAVRVGTCTALDPRLAVGELLTIAEAHAWTVGHSGRPVLPDAELTASLRAELPGVRAGAVASLDVHHGNGAAPAEAGDVADMQTATLCERGLELGVELAAVLIVTEDVSGGSLDDEPLATAAKRAGAAAAAALGPSKPESNPKVEG